MGERKIEKASALFVSLMIAVIAFLPIHDWRDIGIFSGCGVMGRLAYPFFHVNILHAALNAWCLLSVMFMYNVSMSRLLLAYAVAAAFPVDTIGLAVGSMSTPTVGLSSVVFFLFGSISFEVRRRLYYQSWMVFYLLIGFVFPNTNGWIHAYCYLAGVVVALLNKPFFIPRRGE